MITGLYSGLLALLFFKISIDTIKARRSKRISIGSGTNNEISHLVSAHSNFAAYTPIFLILCFFVESSQLTPGMFIHATALIFLAGRIFHYLAFIQPEMNFKYRSLGMHMTLWPLLILAVGSIAIYFYLLV